MVSPVTVVKSEGPKLVPFFKATCVYFVLWLPSSSPSATRIFVGLVFSALGDAFLIWQDQGYFVHGLSAGSRSEAGTRTPPPPPSWLILVKSEGPKLVPFFKATCVYFVLWLPSSSPSWVSALIKCLPIFCLWVFLLAHGLGFWVFLLAHGLGSLLAHPSATRIFVGLVFSALGDAFLIWQDQGYFVHGLLMFAVTHLLYSSAFGMRPLALRTGLVLAVLSGLFYALLYPGLTGAFTYLVGVYVALISFMGWRAMAGLRLVGAAWRWTELAAGSGALLFIVSDMTIALDKFCFPVPYSRALIMSTYYAAQMLIALSAVESREPVEDCKLSKAN
ncbi:Lysoplasmalogenase-like protein TMEM86A [Tupaia chinensis]|uniref:lysoplasmalogenase n=1 Tax=Tupaia chinensis TaxID=246437 RepID=L9L7W1_TUPCH|nr:Lysoplasmalogenase-like protein TMEM86A [Tupaia chinensis]